MSAWKGRREGKVLVKFQRAAFVRQVGVIRIWARYGYGCGRERMTGSGNGAPCYWETDAGDLDLESARFPVTRCCPSRQLVAYLTCPLANSLSSSLPQSSHVSFHSPVQSSLPTSRSLSKP